MHAPTKPSCVCEAADLKADPAVSQVDAPESRPDDIVLQPCDQVMGAVSLECGSKLLCH